METLSTSNAAPDFSGKVVLVTGGTTGIGRASAELFHAAGANVIITGENADRIAAARRELPESVLVLRSDARSLEDAEALASTIESRFGKLDVAFLNAGIAKLAPFEAVTEAHYAEHMDINVKGVVFTLQKLLRLLPPGASVVVNSSLASQRGAPNMSIYAASKGAVSALVRTLAVELAGRGIRINSVAPAGIQTPIQEKFGLPPEVLQAAAQAFSAKVPLGRFGRAHEVARAVLFLASPGAAFITGVELAIDGGLSDIS